MTEDAWDDWTCPECGAQAEAVVVLGPGEAYAAPCGCQVPPPG